jgi:hypothetical protein
MFMREAIDRTLPDDEVDCALRAGVTFFETDAIMRLATSRDRMQNGFTSNGRFAYAAFAQPQDRDESPLLWDYRVVDMTTGKTVDSGTGYEGKSAAGRAASHAADQAEDAADAVSAFSNTEYFYGFYCKPGIGNGSLVAFLSADDRDTFEYKRNHGGERFSLCRRADAISSRRFAEVLTSDGENAGGVYADNVVDPDTGNLVSFFDAEQIEIDRGA